MNSYLRPFAWISLVVLITLCLGPVLAIGIRLLVATSSQRAVPELAPAVYASLLLAVVVGVSSALIGSVLGMSYCLHGMGKVSAFLLTLALITPEVAIAASLRELAVLVGAAPVGIEKVILGQLWFPTAMAALLVFLRLESLSGGAVVIAARQMGSGWRHIVPLLAMMSWPAAVVGGLTGAAISLQDVVFPMILGSAESTVMPRMIYSGARFGVQPWMLWYSLLVLCLGTVLTGAFMKSEATSAK